MIEMGLIKKWMENSLGRANKCSNMAKILQSHKRKEIVLNLREMSTFFFLVLAGLGTTGLIFGIEMITRKGRKTIKERAFALNEVQHPHGPGEENKIAWAPSESASQLKMKQ